MSSIRDIPEFANVHSVQQTCRSDIPEQTRSPDIPGFPDARRVDPTIRGSQNQAAEKFLSSFVNHKEEDNEISPVRTRSSNRYEPYRSRDRHESYRFVRGSDDRRDRTRDDERGHRIRRSVITKPYNDDTISYADSIESLRGEIDILFRTIKSEVAKNNESYAYLNQRFLDIERTIYSKHKMTMIEHTARKKFNKRKLDTNGSCLYGIIQRIENITELMQRPTDPDKNRSMQDTLKTLEILKQDASDKRLKIKASLCEPAPW